MSEVVVREEAFIPCCDDPPRVECCDCPDGISSIWEVQDDLSGMYDNLSTEGCAGFDGAKTLQHYSGPIHPGQPDYTGDCYWASTTPQAGVCYGPLPNAGSATIVMGCWINEEVPPVDPIYQWHLDCACDDLWVGDISEWGSLEDCLEYDSNCRCSNENGAYLGSESECEAVKSYYEGMGITCGECEYVQVTSGYPGSPRVVSHTVTLSGVCGCFRNYVLLDPNNSLCKDMLGDVETSTLPPFDCEGCNTYVLVQYIALDIFGNEAPGYPCGFGAVHIQNGTDVGCNENCGYTYGCLGYPATITLCPAQSITPSSTTSACNPNVLCCGTPQETTPVSEVVAKSLAPPVIPDDSLHFQFMGTGTSGYLIKDGSGLYTGEVPPIALTVDRSAKTLNGKPLTMLSDDIFWARGRIGGEHLGFWIEVME